MYYRHRILLFFCYHSVGKKNHLGKYHNPKKTAIKYMKETMTPDEMWLLIEKFYDKDNHQFRSSGMIEFSDDRKTALESKFVLYRASSMSEWYSFAYNLQPYAYEFLNCTFWR